MADHESQEPELTEKQKKDIAKWFLTNSPAGEIQYIAKDVRSVLMDEDVYNMAVSEAFPLYNKAHLVFVEMPNRTGDVLITAFGELDETSYLDPRTAQVATIDHVKQVCTEVRPATDEELPSSYIEEFRSALDDELVKYVNETYPKGNCSVYCIDGKDTEGPGADFELGVVISAARHSPQNFCNGSWRSIWNVKFNDDLQVVELSGKIQVGAHYFEEGNVQLDANHECKDSTILQYCCSSQLCLQMCSKQSVLSGTWSSMWNDGKLWCTSPEDSALAVTNMVRHHETEYMASLEASYSNLPDTTFKDLRRKLPVTRTLFPWHNTLQFSLTKDISKELGIGK